MQGILGTPHIALQNITSMEDVQKLQYHLKFLSGDFLTAEWLARDNNSSPQCKLCHAAAETTAHVLTKCRATPEVYKDLIPTLLNTVQDIEPNNHLLLSIWYNSYWTAPLSIFQIPTVSPYIIHVYEKYSGFHETGAKNLASCTLGFCTKQIHSLTLSKHTISSVVLVFYQALTSCSSCLQSLWCCYKGHLNTCLLIFLI